MLSPRLLPTFEPRPTRAVTVQNPDRSDPDRSDPDREILERVATGDTEAFGELVERHQDRLINLCRRFLGDPEAARDAAQDVFLKIFRKAGTYRPKGKVSTWMHRIAVNHCLNRLRRRRIVSFLSFGELGKPSPDAERDAAVFDPPDIAADPESRLASRRRWRRTREALDSLPPNQRAVLILAKFEGFSYREIAETLEITESAVESRLFRAMRKITQTLEKAQDLPD